MAETEEVRGLIQDWEDELTAKLYWKATAKRAEADRAVLLKALRGTVFFCPVGTEARVRAEKAIAQIEEGQ